MQRSTSLALGIGCVDENDLLGLIQHAFGEQKIEC